MCDIEFQFKKNIQIYFFVRAIMSPSIQSTKMMLKNLIITYTENVCYSAIGRENAPCASAAINRYIESIKRAHCFSLFRMYTCLSKLMVNYWGAHIKRYTFFRFVSHLESLLCVKTCYCTGSTNALPAE